MPAPPDQAPSVPESDTAELRRRREELDDLYNQAPCGFHSIDADGVIQRINDTELGWLGCNREDIVGKRRITEFLSPRSLETFHANFATFKATGKVDELEFELVGKDGSLTPVLLSGTAIYDERGRYVGSRSVLMECRSLNSHRETLRRSMHVAPIAVAIVHGTDDRIVAANNAFCNLLRIGAEEAIGVDFGRLFREPQAYAGIRHRLLQGYVIVDQRVELHLPEHPDVPHVSLLASFMVTEYLGERSMVVWLCNPAASADALRSLAHDRDRLALQVEELAYRLSNASEAAHRVKATILKNVNHELRTPLNGILGMISLVRRRMVDPRLDNQLRMAEISAKKLSTMLAAMIDLAADDADQLTLSRVPIDLSAILVTLHKQFEDKASAKGLTLAIGEVRYGRDVPRRFIGDPMRLQQMLRELLTNAIDFSDTGQVELQAAIDPDAAGQLWLHCTVRDEGVGIPKEKRRDIFEAFTQVDGSNARRHCGMGNGLALCRSLADRMGGTIDVESEPGKGSTFTLRLPLEAARSSVTRMSHGEAVAAIQARHACATVLVAVPDPVINSILSECLESADLNVYPVKNSAEALEVARVVHLDLILLNRAILEQDEPALMNEIRIMPLYARTPILEIVSGPQDDAAADLVHSWVDGRIGVPFAPEELLNRVVELLDGSPAAMLAPDPPSRDQRNRAEPRT